MNKIEKLELKHLCGYLPYDVYAERDGDITRIMPYHLGMRLKQIERGQIFKLCLLPLSALTEQEYSFIYENETDYESIEMVVNMDCESFMCCKFSFEFWEKLFENHFDIYGLIESGLAIDKRTVKL